MPPIDHLAYPHIMDLVWAHMPYPALVAASQTCRAWRERSIPHLAEHVSIRRGQGEGLECELIVTSRNLQYPELSIELGRGTVAFWQLGMCAPLPRQRWYLKPVEAGAHAARSRWIGVFKRTRVVDWHGFRSLAIEEVGILPAMLRNRPLGWPQPVWRLFENFGPGETLGDTLDWAPNVIFLDIDARRGRALPACGPVERMFVHEEGAKSPRWRDREVTLSVRCFSDPCADLVATARSTSFNSRMYVRTPIVVTATDIVVSPTRMVELLKGLQFSTRGHYGLDKLLPPGVSWYGLLVAIPGLVERADMFLFDGITYDSPGDYITTAWQDTKEHFGTSKDWGAMFPDKYIFCTVR